MELGGIRKRARENLLGATTGEAFTEDSPYNEPTIIRALFTVGEFIRRAGRQPETKEEKQKANLELGRPKNYGLRWSDDDRAAVAAGFRDGKKFTDLASDLGRTCGSIESELVKQGLVEPPDDNRWRGRPPASAPNRTP